MLTFFAAGADGVHVPKRLHEGRVHLEFSTGGGQVLESSKDVREPGRKGDLGGGNKTEAGEQI